MDRSKTGSLNIKRKCFFLKNIVAVSKLNNTWVNTKLCILILFQKYDEKSFSILCIFELQTVCIKLVKSDGLWVVELFFPLWMTHLVLSRNFLSVR